MTSPFPGMDPFLEAPDVWEMVHTHFIVEAHRRLARSLPPAYEIRTESRLYIHEPTAAERRFFARADLSVTDSGMSGGGVAMAPATAAPTINSISTVMETVDVRYLTIRTRDGARVVTVLELLSPTNKKRGSDREQFLSKRAEILKSDSHYVEIDLLRSGPRLPFDREITGTYYAAVSRAERRPALDVWAWALADPIPPVPVPLRSPDPDAVLDVNSCLDAVVDAAGLPARMYARAPEPPLSAPEDSWVRERL